MWCFLECFADDDDDDDIYICCMKMCVLCLLCAVHIKHSMHLCNFTRALNVTWIVLDEHAVLVVIQSQIQKERTRWQWGPTHSGWQHTPHTPKTDNIRLTQIIIIMIIFGKCLPLLETTIRTEHTHGHATWNCKLHFRVSHLLVHLMHYYVCLDWRSIL